MNNGLFRPALIAALTTAAMMMFSSISAEARPRPGTPIHLSATPVDPHTVRLYWENTNSTSNTSATVTTYFDIEGSKGDPSVANIVAALGFHEAMSYDVTNLAMGRQHCFRVWSRESPNGIRSELPTAWSCANLPGPVATKPVPHPERFGGTTIPLYLFSASVWISANKLCLGSAFKGEIHDYQLALQSTGFVLYAPKAQPCPDPWQQVQYQYGGFPAMSPAGPTSGKDPYNLCWYERIPQPGDHAPIPDAAVCTPVGPSTQVCQQGSTLPKCQP
jgi:hypothetical protein